MQEIVSEVFLYDVALIATTNYEFIDAMVGIALQNMPQDGLAADLHHRFWFGLSFFAEASAKTTGKDYGFNGKKSSNSKNSSRIFSKISRFQDSN